MKTLLLATFLLAVTGCSAIDLDAGGFSAFNDTRERFAGHGAIVKFEARGRRQLTKYTTGYCSVMHVSNYRSGPPFNDSNEDYIDAAGCGLIYTIKVR